MDECVRVGSYVCLRLPSDTLRVIQVQPDALVHLGKYGAFESNQIIGQPYYLTFEIQDSSSSGIPTENGDSTTAPSSTTARTKLRIVSASELALGDALLNESTQDGDPTTLALPPESDSTMPNGLMANDLAGISQDGRADTDAGSALPRFRTNQHLIDDASHQTLSMTEIEALKRADATSGREVLASVLAAHTQLDQKTIYARQKYTLRKAKKYLKRFTILPLTPPQLIEWIRRERDFTRILEIRPETLAILMSYSNVHRIDEASDDSKPIGNTHATPVRRNRWLVVDDAGGLIVAAMAERLGILYPEDHPQSTSDATQGGALERNGNSKEAIGTGDTKSDEAGAEIAADSTNRTSRRPLTIELQETAQSATSNTLTLIHANTQPNLSLLPYFGFDVDHPTLTHPLHTHLKTLSWLQLLEPSSDSTYQEPQLLPDEEIASLKPSRKGLYYRKRRRWQRTRNTVDEARSGGFDGLVVATSMSDLPGVMHHLVPLVRGGGTVAVYSPHVEPLTELVDAYSTGRRAAFWSLRAQAENVPSHLDSKAKSDTSTQDMFKAATGTAKEHTELPSAPKPSKSSSDQIQIPSLEFPLDPTLLLAPTIYTARLRAWQVLPGRTHPKMTSPGGPEGYVFAATRVLPAEGRVMARGTRGGSSSAKPKGERSGARPGRHEGKPIKSGKNERRNTRSEKHNNDGQSLVASEDTSVGNAKSQDIQHGTGPGQNGKQLSHSDDSGLARGIANDQEQIAAVNDPEGPQAKIRRIDGLEFETTRVTNTDYAAGSNDATARDEDKMQTEPS